VKFKVGEEGPEDMAIEAVRLGKLSVMEPDRGPTEGFREDEVEDGRVGARAGCCRIRRNPDAPSPCSCSAIIGDLGKSSAPLRVGLVVS
jgi:hypothetical protein